MGAVITIEQPILGRNADWAAQNRALLERHGVFAIGLVSAPGSGKTSLLERLLPALHGRARVAVVEGDVQTDRDARRIATLDVPVVQIVTNGTCHLEARLLADALPRLPLDQLDLLFVENVGNLVCPASYALGEHLRLVLTSTPEGDDKALKYPALFRHADALVINKIDLLPYVDFDIAAARAAALQVNPRLRVFETACTRGLGIDALLDWLLVQRQAAGLPAL